MDVVQSSIGSFGRYQLCMCFLLYLCKFPVAFHQMAIIFLSPPTSYICPDTGKESCPCKNPKYDDTTFNKTIVMQWDLICDRKWLREFTQTIFQFGVLAGSVCFGMASDRFGRRITLNISVILQVLSGVIVAYIPNYWAFSLIRMVVGAAVGGTMVVSFVIVMEIVGKEYRDIISAFYQVPFNLGHIMLPGFGYYFRHYADFQMAISLPTALLLSYLCLVPESPRWLLAMNQTENATLNLLRAAKINNLPHDSIRPNVDIFQAEHANTVKKGTVLDLFRTPNIRRNTLCMSFNWLVCSFCFYGVSQYIGHLSGDIFTNVAASGAVALCGTLLSIPLMRFMPRKLVVIISNVICSICLLCITFFDEGLTTVILACIGVMFSFIVFVVIYLYCSELFPTVVRNNAIGISSMMARLGSMVAPFVVGLKDYGHWYPPVMFGVMPLLAALACLLIPETKGCKLTDTIEEGENFGTNPVSM